PPAVRKGLVIPVAALSTGAVAGGIGGRLVKKEEFAIGAWPHHPALATAEGQAAGNPVLMAVGAQDALFIVVQDTPVAHQRTAGGNGVKTTEGIDTVLVGHQRSPPFKMAKRLSINDWITTWILYKPLGRASPSLFE